MKTSLAFGKIKSVFFLAAFLALVFPVSVSADSYEWVSPDYNFKDAKSIWIKTPDFSYEYAGFILGGQNKTVNYPYAEEKIDGIINDNTKKITKLIVYEKFVKSENKNAPTQQEKSIFKIDDEKYASLTLTIKIMDLGWFYEHYDPYTSWEDVVTREKYRELDSKGNVIHEGTREITRQVPVYHPAGYHIIDSAAAEFLLTDSKTGQVVWKYSDRRDRRSGDSATSYDKSGPESMLKRIFASAFGKAPFK